MVKNRATKQQVIDLLKSGEWELGYSSGTRSDGYYWIQQGGLCKGGQTLKVHTATVESLLRTKFIEVVPRIKAQPFWLRKYKVSP